MAKLCASLAFGSVIVSAGCDWKSDTDFLGYNFLKLPALTADECYGLCMV